MLTDYTDWHHCILSDALCNVHVFLACTRYCNLHVLCGSESFSNSYICTGIEHLHEKKGQGSQILSTVI